MKPRIITEHVCPPGPLRSFDWSAWWNGDDNSSLEGHGVTEEGAVIDLLIMSAANEHDIEQEVLVEMAFEQWKAENEKTEKSDLAAVVKPMEWVEDLKGLYCVTDVGRYDVFKCSGGKWRWHVGYDSNRTGLEDTETLAKAAAQADFDKRYLEKITIRPAHEVAAEAREAALREAFDKLSEIIANEDSDGISAEGNYSESVMENQRKFLDGISRARLAVYALFTPTKEPTDD
jgi:hypothetical protein